MLHLANTVQPAFRRWFYPDEAAGPGHAVAVQHEARLALEAAFARMDEHLQREGPYFCGDHPTAVDYHAVMLARWSRNLPKSALAWPALAALVTLMTSRPGFAAVCAAEQLSAWP